MFGPYSLSQGRAERSSEGALVDDVPIRLKTDFIRKGSKKPVKNELEILNWVHSGRDH